MSPPEVVLWAHLRGRKLGVKVRRQHPIGPYVADFFIRERGLVIEIDGTAHEFGDRPAHDEGRDRYMRELGYRMLRIAASEVMRNLDGVLSYIALHVNSPLHYPSDGPTPHAGEDC